MKGQVGRWVGERVELRGTQRGKVKVEWWERGGGGGGRREKNSQTAVSLLSINHTCFLRGSVVQVGRYELTFLRYSSRTAHVS